jgi:hypothetical protein
MKSIHTLFTGKEASVDFQLLSNFVNIELDNMTGWVKVTRVTGEVFLIQPRDALALMTWSQGNAHTLVASQQAIDQEASLYANSVQGQARPVRLVEALPLQEEPDATARTSRKGRRRRTPLPLPSIQISEALPCLVACKTKTMTALLDFGTGLYAPWQLYPLCEEHLRAVLSQREATGLSLRVIIEQLRTDA